MEAFRTWIVSQSRSGKYVCTCTDLMKVRLRYVKTKDEKALLQLDTWIIDAAEKVSESTTANP